MTTLITLAGQIAGAWATATELAPLLAVPAAVWGLRTSIDLLDRLAAAAQLTYAAGRACGRLWYAHGLQALLAAADGTSWLLSQVDWADALATTAAAGRAALALLITTALQAHRLLVATSAALGRRYSALLVSQAGPAHLPAAEPAAPAAPALATSAPAGAAAAGPAAPSGGVAPLTGTVRQLRARCRAAGLPSRLWKSATKAELTLLLA